MSGVSAREPAAGEVLPGVWGAARPAVRPLRHGAATERQVLSGVRATGRLGRRRSSSLHVARVLYPRHLAEKILTSKGALEGERKRVTVLFADLKGSTELIADRDPEEARKILAPVLAHMMEAVHHYEGTVNQVMGDGIMALFGAPIAHEDHAVRACYAALRMQESVSRYADEARRAHGATVQIRVGLNSGDVVVGAIGNDLHMDYTAVGETTHLAARMEQAARPGTVLIAPATLELVEGFVAVKALGPVPVKGLREPVEVYELSGIGPARTRLRPARGGGSPGSSAGTPRSKGSADRSSRRAPDTGRWSPSWARPAWGNPASSGSSRARHRTQGWLVLESGSVSYGRATPYLPVIELLKTYLGIQERDDPRAMRERVAGKLLTLDRTLEPLVTPLLALLDVPVDDAAWSALDPPQRRQRILEAVTRLLLRESQVQPLLVLVEDLHWIDSESQAWLDGLIERLPTARILLLVTYRPEYQHAWGSRTYYTQLRIDPLPPESADALLTALLGPDGTLEPLKRVLIERSAGNPFFLEESVRALVETQVLVGDRGAYRMPTAPPQAEGRPEAWQIPATVQAILAARIDRLAPEDKRLLQAAAVIGKMCRSRSSRPSPTSRAQPSPGAHPPPGGRVPPRDEPLPGSRVHLQARPHARGRVREPAPGPAARPPCPDRGGPGDALPRSAGRAGGAPGPPCRPGRAVGEGRHVPPAGRRQGARPLGVPGGGDQLRAGPGGVAPAARHAREGRARDRSASRPSPGALPAQRARDGLAISPGSGRAGQNA